MKIIETKETISASPASSDDLIVYVLGKDLIVESEFETRKLDVSSVFNEEGGPWMVYCSNKRILLLTIDNNFFEVDAYKMELRQLSLNIKFQNSSSLKVLESRNTFFDLVGDIMQWGVFDIDKNEILWKSKTKEGCSVLDFSENKIFRSENRFRNVGCYDLATGKCNWSKEYGNVGNYEDFFDEKDGWITDGFIYNDQLILSIEGHHLVSINTNSGKENWRHKFSFVSPASNVDIETGRIHVISFKDYVILNSQTGEVEYSFDLSKFYQKFDFHLGGFSKPSFYKDFLLTVHTEGEKSWVLKFNKNSGELIEHIEIGEMIPVVMYPPVQFLDKYYVVGDSKNLYKIEL